MVRKHKANSILVPIFELSSSFSSAESRSSFEVVDLNFGIMAKKKKLPIVNQARVRDFSLGYSLNGYFGVWEDTQHHFVKRNPSIPQSFYYRDMSEEYANNTDFPYLEVYNNEEMDRVFEVSVGVGFCYSLFRDFATDEEMDDIVRAVFHLDGDIESRWS